MFNRRLNDGVSGSSLGLKESKRCFDARRSDFLIPALNF